MAKTLLLFLQEQFSGIDSARLKRDCAPFFFLTCIHDVGGVLQVASHLNIAYAIAPIAILKTKKREFNDLESVP